MSMMFFFVFFFNIIYYLPLIFTVFAFLQFTCPRSRIWQMASGIWHLADVRWASPCSLYPYERLSWTRAPRTSQRLDHLASGHWRQSQGAESYQNKVNKCENKHTKKAKETNKT